MMHRGSCLCGGVRFTVEGDLPPGDACHCLQCRKSSGHYFASTDVPREALALDRDDTLRWYRSSEKVRRGFCGQCGASLFWDPIGRAKIAIAMGAFDGPTQSALHAHIFVGEKGDYYDLVDGLTQHLR